MPGNESELFESVPFTISNVLGVETTTSFTLPNTPLYFKPIIDGSWPAYLSNKMIVWDFGDGTKSEAVTGVHAYDTPGSYQVCSYLYDDEGKVYSNTVSAVVDIHDFITDRIVLSAADDVSHLTGEFKNPINIQQFNSSRTYIKNNSQPAPVLLHANAKSFSGDYDFFQSNITNNTYSHLLPSYTFIQTIDGVENIPVSAINSGDYSSIYMTVSNSEFVTTPAVVNSDSVFVGISSESDIFFKSDIVGEFDLYFGFEQGSIFNYINTTTYGISALIEQNTTVEGLTITSNGIDGENININTFNINPVKFASTDISFVVKLKDDDGFSNKALPLMEIDPLPGSSHLPLTATLTDGVSTYNASFNSDTNSLTSFLVPISSAEFYGGMFKGYFSIDTDTVLEDVWLEVTTVYNSVTISGTSSKFSIYPKDHYIVAKYGEDIDFKDVFKGVSIQPLFIDSRVLMNDFLGSIFGSIESAQDSIGKGTYEKIQNFLDNNSVIDYVNIDQLASILQSFDLPKINKYSLPPKIKRLMDLLSISQSRLFGNINQNREDFNSFGYLDNSCYGIDRCDPIPNDGIVFAGFDIVAFEKFSGKWTTLNTMLPLCASSAPTHFTWTTDPIEGLDITSCFNSVTCTPILTESLSTVLVEGGYFSLCLEGSWDFNGVFSSSTLYYKLSDYNATWGWPLTLDGDGTLFDVYEFYYKPEYDKVDVEGSVINFDDVNTTIEKRYTHSEWTQSNGVMSNIIANALYDGLGLFNED